MAEARIERAGEIAVVVLDHPPVNALSHALRASLAVRLAEAMGDDAVKAVVIACAGRTFVAGADINELGQKRAEPLTSTLAASLDAAPKPVIAAIHGTALGGGLELAMGCHWRVASPEARFGQPEVKLGIIPGAGGTQRLPRAIGAPKALDMITTGDPIGAAEALKLGLIDEVAAGDLRAGAIAFARRVLAEKRPLRRLRDLPAKDATPELFARARAEIAKKSRGFVAPVKAVDAVEAASLPFDQGMTREHAVFAELQGGPQFRALRHVFFAERETAKLPGPALTPLEIGRVAVIGAGTMGGGIAMAFASAGIAVTLIESSREALDRGLALIRRNYESSAKRQNLPPDEIEQRLERIEPVLTLDAAALADLIIEAVFEDLGLKQQVFRDLDRIARPGALLATNTSYQDVDAIASVTKRPQDVLGLHFFSPAHVMRLVEVVRAKHTATLALASAVALVRRIRKLPVVVGASPGFVGNRMLAERARECERLLQQGALPQEVDKAMTDFGFPMGPFAASDLAGNDVSWRARQGIGLKSPVADALCEAGRFGQKTGAGYYKYAPGSREAVPDPEAEKIMASVRTRLGHRRREFTAAEIVERIIYPLVNEGARLLEEGVAQRPGDIDMVWLNGYGFPAWRGGPMFYADEIGLKTVRDRLDRMARDFGEPALAPAPLLERRIKEGSGFNF